MFIEPTVLGCGHVFCSFCIGHWMDQQPSCPLCRTPVLRQLKVPVFKAYIESFTDRFFTDEAKASRASTIEVITCWLLKLTYLAHTLDDVALCRSVNALFLPGPRLFYSFRYISHSYNT